MTSFIFKAVKKSHVLHGSLPEGDVNLRGRRVKLVDAHGNVTNVRYEDLLRDYHCDVVVEGCASVPAEIAEVAEVEAAQDPEVAALLSGFSEPVSTATGLGVDDLLSAIERDGEKVTE